MAFSKCRCHLPTHPFISSADVEDVFRTLWCWRCEGRQAGTVLPCRVHSLPKETDVLHVLTSAMTGEVPGVVGERGLGCNELPRKSNLCIETSRMNKNQPRKGSRDGDRGPSSSPSTREGLKVRLKSWITSAKSQVPLSQPWWVAQPSGSEPPPHF